MKELQAAHRRFLFSLLADGFTRPGEQQPEVEREETSGPLSFQPITTEKRLKKKNRRVREATSIEAG